MKKNFIGILVACFMMISCSHNIDTLENETLSYFLLPFPVQDTLMTVARNNDPEPTFIIFDNGRYKTETIERITGPFLKGYSIKDKKYDKEYFIDRGTPIPFIVYDNTLFIPTEFNYAFYESELRNIKYKKYKLK